MSNLETKLRRFYDSTTIRLRHQSFDNRLEDEPWVGTLNCRYLLEIDHNHSCFLSIPIDCKEEQRSLIAWCQKWKISTFGENMEKEEWRKTSSCLTNFPVTLNIRFATKMLTRLLHSQNFSLLRVLTCLLIVKHGKHFYINFCH